MSNIFIKIYDFFENRKPLMYSILFLLVAVFSFLSLQIKFTEDITSFFPTQNKKQSIIFENLKVKDNIIVMLSFSKNKGYDNNAEDLINASNIVYDKLVGNIDTALITEISKEIDSEKITQTTQFIYDNLPFFIDEVTYNKLEQLTDEKAINSAILDIYYKLLSPTGSYMQEYLFADPLGLSNQALANLQYLNRGVDYQIYDQHIFSSDMSMLIMNISPRYSLNNYEKSTELVDAIEFSLEECEKMDGFKNIDVEYFGGPAVAVYNSKQIKSDIALTLSLSFIIIIIFIYFAFKNRWTVFLIVFPAIFGALFSLAIIYLLKGEISSIAAGSGSIVLGIALSYSIHVLSHSNHQSNKRKIIKDLTYPLIVGSFTTIGAFLGLLFTSSPLLQDFGLFSALTLIGTTLFSLIFLPHFINHNAKLRKSSWLLKFIEKISTYKYHKNKFIVFTLLLLIIASLFLYNKVTFNSDMMELNYTAPHLKIAEAKLSTDDDPTLMLIAANKDEDCAIREYHTLNNILKQYRAKGEIADYSTIETFVLSDSLQTDRLYKWSNFWTEERIKTFNSQIDRSAAKYGIKAAAFSDFKNSLAKKYDKIDYKENHHIFSEWISKTDSLSLFICYAVINDSVKYGMYKELHAADLVAVDRSYYVNNMMENLNKDFYLILYISSFLVLFALLISYGRIELAVIAFLPMLISWLIILSLMYLLGIEFNIINIILSTFIFGIGDDFSIFIMDGLLYEYKTGRKMLNQHKTAIMLSAITVFVGTGTLIFAGHPALKSVAIIAVLGLFVVLLVSYTIQPIIFNILVSKQVKKGGFPNTFMGFIYSFYAFGLFFLGCIFLKIYHIILFVFVKRVKGEEMLSKAISWASKTHMDIMPTAKIRKLNPYNVSFDTPAVIISNHQSFIDILILKGLNPKFIMVTNKWVWNSPFFGGIVRYSGFCNVSNGYDELVESLKPKIKEGYSVIVFPEGTRSKDNEIHKFHKGAFYLADKLKLDIVPILLYGNGFACSKTQPLYIKKGYIVSKVLRRIQFGDVNFGSTYQERCKIISKYVKAEYELIKDEYSRAYNHYFYDALMKSYIYKGPVLEWYMRIKVRLEKSYEVFDLILPRQGFIVDIGCGYGGLSYMLNLLSSKRKILGLDYDADKIEVCQNSYLKNDNMRFENVDVCDYLLPKADAFVISDMLHYLDYEKQERLISEAITNVSVGGKVVIREGDSDDVDKHKLTEQTEIWSTKYLNFNKTQGKLYFTSITMIKRMVSKFNVSIEIQKQDTKTSNIIYIITKHA